MRLPRRKFLHLAAGAAVGIAHRAGAVLSGALHHDGGTLRGRWRIRYHRPHHRGADGRTARPNGNRGDRDWRRGIIGVQRVIHAKPDGYTVLLGSVGTHAYNQSIYRKHRYDAVSDFTPVTLFSDQPMVLEGRKNLPANNLTEFIALLKQNGTKMQYGSAGVGSTTHLACALLNARIGVEVTHVPYRGGGPLANDLIGGQIDYMCGNMGSSAVRVAAKQSKPLALLSRERTPLMPELATAHEQGINVDVVTWTAFFLPKGAPKDIVVKLNEATHAAMDTPAIRARFNDIGVVGVAPERRGPEYLAKYVVEEIARWEGPIKDAGLQVD